MCLVLPIMPFLAMVHTPYASSEYLQQPCSYGSEAFPCYTYDLNYGGNGSTGSAAKSGFARSVMGPSGSGKSNGFNVARPNNNLSSKTSALPFNSNTQQSHSSRSMYQNQPLNPLNKLSSGIQFLPNAQLRHIILENNENRAVTYSRDTQEIELRQGLEMLSIFKSYSAKTSVLDDFNFYEKREKALKAKRNASQANGFRNGDYEKHFEAAEAAKSNQSDPSSLVSLTKNLSLDSQPLQSSIRAQMS